MMATLVWAGIKLLRVHNVMVQKMAWCLVLVSAFAMPAFMRWSALQSQAAMVVPVHQILPQNAVSLETTDTSDDRITTPLVMMDQHVSAPAPAWRAVRWREYIAPVYLVVTAILLLRLMMGVALAVRLWHRSETASVLVDPRANVRISRDLQTPVTIGSTILLPESYPEWDQRKLHMVLAHERAHIRQFDFYLQLIAGVHAVLFWFSPLAWWLKKVISDLSEAISDRAALTEAQSRATYAEILIEFAAVSRRPLAGVAMARSGNIHRRVDRLLVDQKFRSAFTTLRWHYAAAITLVPAALVTAVAFVRVQPAEAMKLQDAVMPQVNVVAVAPAAEVAPVRAVAHIAKVSEPVSAVPVSAIQEQPVPPHDSAHILSNSGEDSYAIVSGNASNFTGSGNFDEAFHRVKSKMHGNYIWFERGGKSYVIEDSTLVAQSQQLFKPMEELGRQQAVLGEQQGRLGAEQGRLGALEANASAPAPDLSKEIANLQEEMKKLQEHQQVEIKQQDLSAIQARIGDLQAKIGAAQAKIGEKQAGIGSQQAELGAKQAKLGEQQAALGKQQARLSAEASQKMKTLIDNAMQNGKARPID
jgi:beta-lactamase regulating signal transducer with metallopeptidase domain